jgi:hypothetical protein
LGFLTKSNDHSTLVVTSFGWFQFWFDRTDVKKQFQNWNQEQGPPARIGHAQDLFLSMFWFQSFLIKRKIQIFLGFSCWD